MDYRKPRGPKGPPEHYTREQVHRYWRNRRKHETRIKRIATKRRWLIDQLGGPVCRVCQRRLPYKKAEIHHMNGREWPMSWPQEKRIDRMIHEFNHNVWLTVLCKPCNAGIGDPRKEEKAA